MSRDDEIRAATIGEPTRADGPIHLAEYDLAWPATYELEANRMRATLGDRVRLLEHVGSTSVPGLAFRDRLRTHDDERERYEAAKRELAARDWTFVQHYADAKGEVIEGIIARALEDARDVPPALTSSAAVDTVRST